MSVTVDATDAPLADVLELVAHQAGLRPSWNETAVHGAARVTVHLHNEPVDLAFAKVLAGTGMQARIVAKRVEIVAERAGTVVANGRVTGTVVDAKTKQPLRGALVSLDKSTKGVTTTGNGMFVISNVPAGGHTVHVRLLGYGKVTKHVDVVDDQAVTVDVGLEAAVNTLDQVVVTGTVVPTELKAIPNAITIITAKELQERGITRIDQLFHGDVPGLFTVQQGAAAVSWTDGVPGSADISSRGGTFLGGGHESIKMYVDGVELANRAYVGMIDPTSIERIEILTGPQASTIYGSNAINGVIQIFTKRGSSSYPQLTATARSAWTQNNLTPQLTPRHTADLSASGVNGWLSYNVGGSWGYTGSWTPGVREQTVSGFGGERVTTGRLTLDGNLRVTQDGNVTHGATDNRAAVEAMLANLGPQVAGPGAAPVFSQGTSADRAVGATGTYALTSWWSHTVTLGLDQLATLATIRGNRYSNPADTGAYLNRINYNGLTAAYNTTVQMTAGSLAKAVVTLGIDESHRAINSVNGTYALVSGAYLPSSANAWRYGQSQAHEHGGFLQSQVGFWNAVFLTYGLRAVYNPNVGKNENPNLEPRYGVALSHELGAITAKLRASYGTATRPPGLGAKDPQYEVSWARASQVFAYGIGGDINRLANPDLVPDTQHGGEGGLEMYVGTVGSLTITRYNQTVDHLVVAPVVDSLPFTPQFMAIYGLYVNNNVWGYPLYQTQNLNIGSVRNQGWETQGTLNLWRFTATGTYSWNKSRLIGITPRYRGQFPQYVAGAPFKFIPEHTYALGVAYVRGRTRVAYNIQGQGSWQSIGGYFWERTGNSLATRLQVHNSRVSRPPIFAEVRRGFQHGDMNVSQQVTRHVDALVQINNLTNKYSSEVDPYVQQAGRTTGLGIRLH